MSAHTKLVEYDVLVNVDDSDDAAGVGDVAGTVGADGTSADGTFVSFVESFSRHLSQIYFTFLTAKSDTKYFGVIVFLGLVATGSVGNSTF